MIFDEFKKFKKNNGGDPFVIQEGRLKEGSIKGFSYRKEWTEDSFVAAGNSKGTVGRAFNPAIIPFLSFFLLFFLSLLLARLAWIQIINGEHYYAMAENNRIRIERIDAKRGIIYDRDKKPLVGNVANFVFYLTPADLPKDQVELDNIIYGIGEILGEDASIRVKQDLENLDFGSIKIFSPLFVADNIPYEKALNLYLKAEKWKGTVLSSRSSRSYNFCSNNGKCSLSLSHVLGYTGKINDKELESFGRTYSPIDYIGKMGIEYFWESDLRGVNGEKYIEVDALGKEKKIINKKDERNGNNLVLSIDSSLQQKSEDILSRALLNSGLDRGVVIILDPNNGEILSLVSLPTFDVNDFAHGISFDKYTELINNPANPLFNRSVSGEYPSGSTIKMVMSAAALEEGIIGEYTAINSTGGIGISEWYFPDWKAGGHGLTTVRKAIAESVNTFFYYIGGGYGDFVGLGVDRIINYAKLFGLGSQTGVDLAGEAGGFLPTPEWKEDVKDERWYIGDTYHLSIGQGDLLATPLQVALFTSVFANGGNLYRPHLVKEILTDDDKFLSETDVAPIRSDFINAYNMMVVRQGMRQAVTSGSAKMLYDLPVSSAGKTGTAQWSSKKNPHAWFTGFAPYEKPEITITVLVEEGREGSVISTQIAKEILYWYFTEGRGKK